MGRNKKEKDNGKKDLTPLREKAETALKKNKHQSEKAAISSSDDYTLLHELQVHQVELEMQNDELEKTKESAEKLLDKYTSLFDFAPIGYFILNREGIILDVNFSGARLLHFDRPDLLKKNFKIFLTNTYPQSFNEFIKDAFEKQVKVYGEGIISVRRDASAYIYFEGIVLNNSDECLLAVTDVTRLKNAEAQAQQLSQTLEIRVNEKTADLIEANYNLKQLNRTLNAMRKSSKAISEAKSEKEFLNEVCSIIVKDCGHRMVWIGYKQNDEKKSIVPVAYSGIEEGYLETLRLTWADTERGRGPTGTTIRTGKTSFCKNMLTDTKFAPWREEAIKRGYASSIVFPLLDDKETFGSLTIYFSEPDPFTEDEVNLLSELAEDLSYGINFIRLREAHSRAETALRESLKKYRLLIENSPGIIQRFDKNLRILYVSPSVEEATGIPPENFIGKTNEELGMPPELCVTWNNLFHKVEELKEAHELVFDFPGPIGIKTYLLKIVPEFASDGSVESFFGMSTDITERRKAEEEIQRFNRLSVGRELRMIELKKEVNDLALKAGLEPPYNLEFENGSDDI